MTDNAAATTDDMAMADNASASDEQEMNEMNQTRDNTMTNKKHRAKGIKLLSAFDNSLLWLRFHWKDLLR